MNYKPIPAGWVHYTNNPDLRDRDNLRYMTLPHDVHFNGEGAVDKFYDRTMKWFNSLHVGPPQATPTHTVESLEANKMVGLYGPPNARGPDLP